MPNTELLTWWESLREQEQYALRKTYKQQTGNSFSPQNLSHLVELETWDLANANLVSLDFLRPFVRIKRLIINKNRDLKKFDGIENTRNISYLECRDTPLRYQPILKKCSNLKQIMYAKGEPTTPQDWEEQCELSDNYEFRQLPLPLLKCLSVNLKLIEEGANPWGASNIYDMYLRYFGHQRIDVDTQSIAPEAFKDLTVIVVDFQFKSNYIQDLDWLRFFPKLQYLDCSYNQLTDLLGIAYCPDLRILNCQNNHIADISAIEKCPRLHTFNCGYNKTFSNNAILAHLGLRNVDTEGSTIIKGRLIIPAYHHSKSKKAYYESLPSLLKIKLLQHYQAEQIFKPKQDELFVPYELIKTFKSAYISLKLDKTAELDSLEWIAIYDDLAYLYCDGNNITDLSPLKFCPDLKFLDCSANNIKDLSPLNCLKQLATLYFSYNPVTDISNLHILPQLRSCKSYDTPLNKPSLLALAYNVDADTKPFVHLLGALLTKHEMQLILINYYFHMKKIAVPMNSDWQNINQIFTRHTGEKSLNHNKLTHITITDIRELKKLNINNYQDEQLTNLFFLQGLSYLEDLDCCFNQLPNFTGLEQASELRQIDAAFNALTSLEGLQNCHKLLSLNLQSNPIKDLSALTNCKNLRIIHLNHTAIEHLRDFDELRDLELLYIGDTKISADEISRFARLHPDCIIDNIL